MTLGKLGFLAIAVGLAPPALGADLSGKAPASIDYVKVCDTYGAGFFYLPGTDTCLKIGGYVRAYAFGGNGDSGSYRDTREYSSISTKARFDLQVDARSQTEFGLLRSVGEVRFNAATPETAYDRQTDGQKMRPYAVTTDLELAYLQWGGFTAGRTQSFFDFYTGYAIEEVYGEAGVPDTKTNLFAYTFGFGNGLTASLSLEDPSTGANRRSGPYGGNKLPDLVANVNVTQSWGSAQVMGVLHQDYGILDLYGNRLGWAVGAGIQFNVPMLGAGDMVAFQATYGEGAAGYVGSSITVYDFDETGRVGALGLNAGYTHVFSKTFSGAIQASYFRVDFPTDDGGLYSVLDLSGSVTWKPSDDLALDLGLEHQTASSDSPDFDQTFHAWVLVGRATRKF